MKAVWSFWSKPFLGDRRSIWTTEACHLLSWILSFNTARQHFGKTVLFTDKEGARLLVDSLGLEFDEVSTGLDILHGRDPQWWALGKIYTYALQTTPFVHIDSDVFLWKPLPFDDAAPLFAQNPEYFLKGKSYYMPDRLESLVRSVAEGWVPVEWQWYCSSSLPQRAESCGIFGGARTDFIRYYAGVAIQFIEHQGNQAAWHAVSAEIERNILGEQYLLSACIEYQRGLDDSPYKDISIQYLFDSQDDAFNPHRAAELGYTHLIAGAKRNQDVVQRLERRVRDDYPAHYERCMRYIAEGGNAGSNLQT